MLIGEGEDNVAYEVSGNLTVRLSQEPDPRRRAGLVTREAAPCFMLPQ